MKKWHTKKIEEIFRELKTSEKGLSEKEARERLIKFGFNELITKKKISPFMIFLRQFKSFLILILLIAVLISATIGKITDALLILLILILNAILGFSQEYKAEKAMEALKKLATPKAMVIRDGRQIEVPARELVPGDLILLEEGVKIPADARLIEAVSLKVDESALTGESIPITKDIRTLKDVELAERKNMIFLGTTVTYGKGKAIVVDTGMQTEMGNIAKLIQVEEKEITPLQIQLNTFAKWLGIFILALCAIVFGIGIVAKKEIFTMFFTAVALAVSAVPEGLPAIISVTLALGMRKMAKRNALIRKLSAVETLGCTTVIAADKTGTMTTNEMTVRKIYCDNKMITVTGVGFEPKGELVYNNINVKKDEHVKLLFKIAALCNDANLEFREGKWHVMGDPTESSLLVAAAKADIWKEKIKTVHPCIAELPFSSERKRMTTIHRTPNGDLFVCIKGAPEIILELCTKVYEKNEEKKLTKEKEKEISEIVHKMASDGLRILAFAYKKIEEKKFSLETVEKDLVFVGLAGMIDPPRVEVRNAIELCKQAGIRVIMLTGDHKLTALAIAKDLNLVQGTEVVVGTELDKFSDKELEEKIETVNVFARVSPAHKLRIVKALQKKGHVVAVTGDGVNDAPALKFADIGVAMGIKGTDVAKEASDMVLTDDNFATIVKAVEEGRGIYDNIKKFVRFLLSLNFSEIFFVSIMIIAGLPFLPLLPIQILWINLVTDGLPALALSADPKDPDIMKRKPRTKKEGILSKALLYIIATGSLLLLSEIVVFAWGYTSGISAGLEKELVEAKARTMALTTAIMFTMFFVWNCRSETRSAFRINPFSNKFLIIAVALSILMHLSIIYIPPLHPLFGTTFLDGVDWIKIILFSSLGLILSPGIFLLK